MYLRKLAFVNFRNYINADIQFSSNLNLIFGLNAQGKTNFLEAIYLLCLGRSFRLAKNQDLLKKEAQFFTIQGDFIKNNEIEKSVVLKYVKDGKKEISIDRKRLNRHSKIFGHFPIVVMAPDEFKITAGGPSERRRFVDILLSQVSLSYLTNLQEYYRILKQRNKILQNIREGLNIQTLSIDPWTQHLAKVGSKIISARNKFVNEFAPTLNSIYRQFTETGDDLEIFIESSVAHNNHEEKCEEKFIESLELKKEKEKFLGMTLVGPHRDDIVLEIDGMDLRKYGSRGEHKSVLISLKIAEFKYLQEKKEETPILLLDDCYSELDHARELHVFNSIRGLGQIFLTSPKETVLNDQPNLLNSASSRFYVENGQIEAIKN